MFMNIHKVIQNEISLFSLYLLMNKLIDTLNSDTGNIIISIIWGLGLSALFRKVCVGRNCIIIKGPNPHKIKKQIYKFNNKCYKYTPYIVNCDSEKNIPS